MNKSIHTTLSAAALLAGTLLMLSSCNETDTVAEAAGRSESRRINRPSPSVMAGTRINVALSGNVSSETANAGDTWHGTVTEYVTGQHGAEVAAGSPVRGVVTRVTPAKRGSRAMLTLGLRSIVVNGREEMITGSSEPVIAGSPRARNLGAIAGGAAAGALIGKVVGDGRNATVGGILGGAATAGVVASSKGYQVVLPDGTVIGFTVNQTVAVR